MARKKKKHALVSTMSGIIQKAKRRGQSLSSHSLSDPEQSENEWGPRSHHPVGVVSDSEDSVFETPVFSRVTNFKAEPRTPAEAPSVQLKTEPETEPELEPQLDLQPEPSKEDKDEDVPLVFATVGEAKQRSITASNSDESQENIQFPPVTLGGASREFAVSRALGKYRQRQSSNSVCDETLPDDSSARSDDIIPKISEDDTAVYEEKEKKIIEEPTIIAPQQAGASPQPELPAASAELSPSPSIHRNHMGNRHFPPRHQQSLEIPWGFSSRGSMDTDDDNRSTHSWRSTSRVSSRRQSTEDSIDSEDEWYCYELRKLEEMERQSQFNTDHEAMMPLVEAPSFEPEEDVKAQMNSVLAELKNKVPPAKSVDEEVADVSLAPLVPQEEPSPRPSDDLFKVCAPIQKTEEEGSSGETSGPDSPAQSGDDLEDDSEGPVQEETSVRRSSSGSTLRQGERAMSREGSLSVPPSEGWDSEETATLRDTTSVSADERRDGAASSADTNVTQPASTVSSPPATGSASATASAATSPKLRPQDTDSGSGKENDAGSKWKLLKALKERKAEEKSQEAEKAAAATTTTTTTTTVSISLERGDLLTAITKKFR